MHPKVDNSSNVQLNDGTLESLFQLKNSRTETYDSVVRRLIEEHEDD